MAEPRADKKVTTDELTTRTKPNEFYIPTRIDECNSALAANKCQEKLKNVIDIVADVINLSSGGTMTPLEEDLPAIKERAANDTAAEIKRVGDEGSWALPTAMPEFINGDGSPSNTTIHSTRKKSVLQGSFEKYHLNYNTQLRRILHDFSEKYDFKSLPGDSPLQRAITFTRMLMAAGGDQSALGQGHAVDDLVDQLGETAELLKNMTDGEKELMMEAMDDEGEEQERPGSGESGTGGLETAELKAAKMAEDMVEGKALFLTVARHLATLSKMHIARSHERYLDPAGRLIDPRQIDNVDNMGKISAVEWAYPQAYRNYRVVTYQSRIYERVRDVAKKQCIYMLVDCSGSMGGYKTYMAGGCIMRALKGVIDEDAEVYIRLFDTALHREHEVKTPEQAKEAIRLLLRGNFSGGGTKITPCVIDAVKRINELMATNKLARPELVLVTDGDDDLRDFTADKLAGIKLHAIVVEGCDASCLHMRELARQSGGININMTRDMFKT